LKAAVPKLKIIIIMMMMMMMMMMHGLAKP